MSSYRELLAQRAELDAEIERLRLDERDNVIIEIRQKMSDYQIPLQDLAGGKKAKNVVGPKRVAAKYRNPETGAEWTGRGKPPNWIKDVGDRTPYQI